MTKDIPHGTWSSYTNRKCRCDDCRAAAREYHRQRYAKDPSKYTKYSDAWRAANPERVRENQRRSQKLRYAERPDVRAVMVKRAAEWTEANREKSRQIKSAYKKRNPDQVRLDVERRRARKAGLATYEVTPRQWLRLCRRFNGRCAYCGERSDLTQDHVVPVALGGHFSIGNLLPACGKCNSSKGDKLLVEWRRYLKKVA